MFSHPYWSAQYFPPVWFAPGDESAAPPEEIRPEVLATGLGATMMPRKRRGARPFAVPAEPFAPPQTEEDDALMLCGML